MVSQPAGVARRRTPNQQGTHGYAQALDEVVRLLGRPVELLPVRRHQEQHHDGHQHGVTDGHNEVMTPPFTVVVTIELEHVLHATQAQAQGTRKV